MMFGSFTQAHLSAVMVSLLTHSPSPHQRTSANRLPRHTTAAASRGHPAFAGLEVLFGCPICLLPCILSHFASRLIGSVITGAMPGTRRCSPLGSRPDLPYRAASQTPWLRRVDKNALRRHSAGSTLAPSLADRFMHGVAPSITRPGTSPQAVWIRFHLAMDTLPQPVAFRVSEAT